MIYGIGNDILAIERMVSLYAKHGDEAARRILCESELAAFQAAKDKPRFLAKRFAAKEAFAKAVGTGLRGEVGMRSVAVVHDELGKPVFAYSEKLAAWLAQQGIAVVHLSLSDEKDWVLAFAVAERC